MCSSCLGCSAYRSVYRYCMCVFEGEGDGNVGENEVAHFCPSNITCSCSVKKNILKKFKQPKNVALTCKRLSRLCSLTCTIDITFTLKNLYSKFHGAFLYCVVDGKGSGPPDEVLVIFHGYPTSSYDFHKVRT